MTHKHNSKYNANSIALHYLNQQLGSNIALGASLILAFLALGCLRQLRENTEYSNGYSNVIEEYVEKKA